MIRMIQRMTCLTLFCGAVLLPAAARAQFGFPMISSSGEGPDIDRSGLYLGLGAFGNAIVNQANSGVDFLTSGAGVNLQLGLRLHPSFALEFAVGQSMHNDVSDAWGNTVDYLAINQVTAGAKFILPTSGLPLRPYAQAGLGYYMLTDAWSSDLASGAGIQLGGGLDYWLNPWWTVGARVLYHGIKFSSFTYPQTGQSNSPFLSTVSLEVNVQIHF